MLPGVVSHHHGDRIEIKIVNRKSPTQENSSRPTARTTLYPSSSRGSSCIGNARWIGPCCHWWKRQSQFSLARTAVPYGALPPTTLGNRGSVAPCRESSHAPRRGHLTLRVSRIQNRPVPRVPKPGSPRHVTASN